MEYTLVTTSHCPNCKIVKAGLDKAGIPYTVIDAEDHPEIARTHNLMAVPSLVIEGDGQLRVLKGLGAIKEFIEDAQS